MKGARGLWRASLERHPHVLAYATDGGALTVSTAKGHAFPDGGHTRTFQTTHDALAALKWVQSCRCPRCMS